MTVQGFDISHHQGVKTVAQFREAKAGGFQFMYHKVSEGDGFVDSAYKQNLKNAKEAGLLVGGYHFARFVELTKEDAFREAKNFLAHVGSLAGMLPPMLDDESGSGDHTKPAIDWLNFVSFFSGVSDPKVGLYSYGPFFRTHYQPAKINAYYSWLAQYSSTMTPPAGFDRPDIWQYTSSGHVPGIGDRIDCNRFEGSLAQLDAIVLRPVAPPSPGPNDQKAVAEIHFPDGSGGWRVHSDGGVFTWGTAPFYGSYPGLPAEQRQGDRTFVGIEPRGDGRPGYVLISNHGEKYVFPSN